MNLGPRLDPAEQHKTIANLKSHTTDTALNRDDSYQVIPRGQYGGSAKLEEVFIKKQR